MCRRLRWPLWMAVLLVCIVARADQALWEKYQGQVRTLRRQGDFAGAEKAARAAVAEAQKSAREDSQLAKSWNDLATICYDTGRYAEAEKLFQLAAQLWERLYGSDTVEAAQGLNNLAVLYVKTSRFKEAESLLLRALAIREKALSPEHPDVAETADNLGQVYRALGRYADAEPLYRRSLAILEKAQPAQGATLARSLKTYAAMLRHMKRKPEAAALEARAKAILQGQVQGSAFAESLVN